jgi:catechol 2,3-dioxygenase-like lactoylglutathione lyase family enzyme
MKVIMFERYSFVAITTVNLDRAREFWVNTLGFSITEEVVGQYFIVDAGGLRLCIDRADDEIHKPGGSDPTIGFKVRSISDVLPRLASLGIEAELSNEPGRGKYAVIRDPDGRAVIITESD